MAEHRVTVWHDGACPLCAIEIGLMRRLDAGKGRIRFIDATDSDAACPIDRAALLARFHARRGEDGPLVSGVAAFALMWRQVTPLQPLGWLASIPGAAWLGEPLYRLWLAMRPGLSRMLAKRGAGV